METREFIILMGFITFIIYWGRITIANRKIIAQNGAMLIYLREIAENSLEKDDD